MQTKEYRFHVVAEQFHGSRALTRIIAHQARVLADLGHPVRFAYLKRLSRGRARIAYVPAIASLALALTLSHASAHTMPAPSPNFPQPELPIIGTIAYDAGCTVTQVWEDGSAVAYCPEDGARFVFDPDGDITTGREPGWYAQP